jgi:hypothetical protein
MSNNDPCQKYLELDEDMPSVHLFQWNNCNKDHPNGKYLKISALQDIPDLGKHPISNPFGRDNNGSIVIPAPLTAGVYSNINYNIDKDGKIGSYDGPKIYHNFPGGNGVGNGELKSIDTTLNTKTPLMFDYYNGAPKYGPNFPKFLPYWDNFRARCCAGINYPKFCDLYNPEGKNNVCDYFISDFYKRRKFSQNIKKFCTLDKNQMSSPCDQIMADYCDTPQGKKDKLCSCYNSPFNVIKGSPFCIDKNCILHGYKNQLAKNPCNITENNCKQIIKIGKGGHQNIIDSNKFKLYCSAIANGNGKNGNGTNGNGNGTNGNGKNGNGTNGNGNGTVSFFEKYKDIIYIVLIFVVITIIGFVVFRFRNRIT